MTTPFFSFPNIDKVAFSIGSFPIHWYALAYIAGIILGWYMMRREIKAERSSLRIDQLDHLLNACIFGIIIGGRLGYVLFYNLPAYIDAPLDIFKVWQGGMSFHGGFIGVVLAILYASRRFRINPFALGDEIGIVAPIGLFFGRIANFINGELYGRITDHRLGIIFPDGGGLPRHPSQLYEAGLEGAVLFILLLGLRHLKRVYGLSHGIILSGFITGYGLSRFVIEFVREPDNHLGFILSFGQTNITMGQLLTLPMVIIGCLGLAICMKRRGKALNSDESENPS